MPLKKLVWFCLLMSECTLCVTWYLASNRGRAAICTLEKENQAARAIAEGLQQRVASLKAQLETWKGDPFFTEQRAREELAFSYPGDVVFVKAHEQSTHRALPVGDLEHITPQT